MHSDVMFSETKHYKHPVGALQRSKSDFRYHVRVPKIDFRPQESWPFRKCAV